MANIPDNYDRYVMYETECERLKRLQRRRLIEEEINSYDEDYDLEDDVYNT